MRKLPLIASAAVIVLLGVGFYGATRLEPWVLAKYPEGNWQPAGLKFHDVQFQAEDGVRLHGWYVPHASPKAYVIYAHGAARNVTTRAATLAKLHAHGLAVMIFDYRGYGKSEGAPSEEGIVLDGRAARTWLAQTANLPENQIVLMGHSMGCFVALSLAVERGARGVILSGCGTSLAEAPVQRWWFPTRLLPHFTWSLDSTKMIPLYQGPLLLRHGESDWVAPVRNARKLFELANEPKRLVIDQGGHDDFTDEYWAALDEFVAGLSAAP